MNHSKRWVRSWGQASFLGGAVASILLGGCSLLFDSASATDGGTAGDSRVGADGGQVTDAQVQVVDGNVGDAAVTVDDAGNPVVMVTLTVVCPAQAEVQDLACKCELTDSQGGGDVSPLSFGTKVCSLDATSNTSVMFKATTTKTTGDISEVCSDFTWSVTSGGTTISCASVIECMATISAPSAIRAECAAVFFLSPEGN